MRYSTLNPGFIAKEGNFINFNNTIETPTSSRNGFIRNIITLKNIEILNDKYKKSIETIIANKGKRKPKKSWVSDFQARWWFGQGMGSYSENKECCKQRPSNNFISYRFCKI